MNLVTALALVIGVLGAVATWLFLDPLAAFALSIWAAFIGWASFFSAGGGESGLKTAIVGAIWGALWATIALLAMPHVGGGTLGTAAVVGVTVALMILGAHLPLLASIPASVYGYAATVAFALMKAGSVPAVPDIATNPFLNIVISMAIGAVFGYVSEKIARSLAS